MGRRDGYTALPSEERDSADSDDRQHLSPAAAESAAEVEDVDPEHLHSHPTDNLYQKLGLLQPEDVSVHLFDIVSVAGLLTSFSGFICFLVRPWPEVVGTIETVLPLSCLTWALLVGLRVRDIASTNRQDAWTKIIESTKCRGYGKHVSRLLRSELWHLLLGMLVCAGAIVVRCKTHYLTPAVLTGWIFSLLTCVLHFLYQATAIPELEISLRLAKTTRVHLANDSEA